MGVKDEFKLFGFNVDWWVNDLLNLCFDVFVVEVSSGGNGLYGKNVICFNVVGVIVGWQIVDFL